MENLIRKNNELNKINLEQEAEIMYIKQNLKRSEEDIKNIYQFLFQLRECNNNIAYIEPHSENLNTKEGKKIKELIVECFLKISEKTKKKKILEKDFSQEKIEVNHSNFEEKSIDTKMEKTKKKSSKKKTNLSLTPSQKKKKKKQNNEVNSSIIIKGENNKALVGGNIDNMLNEMKKENNIIKNIEKSHDGHYKIGARKHILKVLNGMLVIRVGGGYMNFTEYLSNFQVNTIKKTQDNTNYQINFNKHGIKLSKSDNENSFELSSAKKKKKSPQCKVLLKIKKENLVMIILHLEKINNNKILFYLKINVNIFLIFNYY